MSKAPLLTLCLIALLVGCRKSPDQSDSIVSMQLRDRNGFSETISNQDRLKVYQKVDFLGAQPYEKVLRVYGKDDKGRSRSRLTSYHDTGGAWQYLEAVDGRANGKYLEWHENATIKIEGTVIEGLADLCPAAQKSWLFDGVCTVWDEHGAVEALFHYDRGQLVDQATYYHPTGEVARIIPYHKGLAHGQVQELDPSGEILEATTYKAGCKHGRAIARWTPDLLKYEEEYLDGLLISGSYFDPKGEKIAELEEGQGIRPTFQGKKLISKTQYLQGRPEGHVELFDPKGWLKTNYQLRDGMKTGEEWEYYPPQEGKGQPKLLITWFEDQIQGMVKTWYEDGTLESQKEMSGNKKHGLLFAYYRSGEPMMVEEYESDRLIKGSYFKKGEKHPVSEVIQGEGTATLYHADGHFSKKVSYELGKPLTD